MSSSLSSAPVSAPLKRKAGDDLPERAPKQINRRIGRSILGGEPDSDEDAGVAPSRRPRASASQAKGRFQKAGGKTPQCVKEIASKAVMAVKKSVKNEVSESDKANTRGPTNVPTKAAPRIIARVPIVPQQEQVAPLRPWFEQYLPKPVKSSKVQPPAKVPAAVKDTTPILAVQVQKDATGELSFEEVWAKSWGWTDIDWAAKRKETKKLIQNAAAGEGALVASPNNKRKAEEDINPLLPKKRASVEPEAEVGESRAPSGASKDAAVKLQKKVKAQKPTKAPVAEEPRKVRTGGSKVVYESKDEVPSTPPRHQVFVASDGPIKPERASEVKNDESRARKQARLDKHAGAQNNDGLSKANSKAGTPARLQQEPPKKTSLSLFQSIQRQGQKPLAPKDLNVRIEKISLGPPLQTARSSINKKPAVSKASRRPGDGEELQGPHLLSETLAGSSTVRSTPPPPVSSTVPAAASSTTPLVASSTTPPTAPAANPRDAPVTDASGAPSTARSRAPSNASVAASTKAPSTAPSSAPSIAPSTTLSTTPSTAPSGAPEKAPSIGATGFPAGSSPKRRAQEPVDEPAAKKRRDNRVSASGKGEETIANEVTAPPKLENSNAHLHSVPEIREYFVSKLRRCTDAAKEGIAEGKRRGKDLLVQIEGSVSLSLGQQFLEMEEAVAKKGKASARKFLSLFSRRSPELRKFNGNSQQDTCEFFHMLVGEIEEEETASEESAAVVSLIKGLFGVEKVTQLKCLCGQTWEREQPRQTTLQVELPTHGRTTLADCVSQTFDTQPPLGYQCEECKERNTTSMKERIRSCSDYMLLNLDRAGTNGFSRTATEVAIPEYVHLDQYMHGYQVAPNNESNPEVRYEVVAFAEHLRVS
ncbi:MAG: hypothetical protein Q9184_005449 [Pyrenodesmia sp. 2 TL-2023]